jgi:hypothetical protein
MLPAGHQLADDLEDLSGLPPCLCGRCCGSLHATAAGISSVCAVHIHREGWLRAGVIIHICIRITMPRRFQLGVYAPFF